MRRICIISFLLSCVLSLSAQSVRLSKGTVVAITIIEDVSSPMNQPPMVIISGDVYDDSGSYIIIKAKTKVTVQLNVRRGNVLGDVGKIEVTPIATKAVNGRQIAFVAEPVVFKGNEHIFNAGMQARISAGTSFIATIANNYVFNVE